MSVDRQLSDAIDQLEKNRQFLDRTASMLKRLRESLNQSREFDEVADSLKTAQKELKDRQRPVS